MSGDEVAIVVTEEAGLCSELEEVIDIEDAKLAIFVGFVPECVVVADAVWY